MQFQFDNGSLKKTFNERKVPKLPRKTVALFSLSPYHIFIDDLTDSCFITVSLR